MALLVFECLLLCRQKPNVPFAGWLSFYTDAQRTRLADVAVFENRQPVTAPKFLNKSSLFILLLGVNRRLEMKSISEQKVEKIFVAPPYCQTACYLLAIFIIFSVEYRGQVFPLELLGICQDFD
jgi:hypothetical protein